MIYVMSNSGEEEGKERKNVVEGKRGRKRERRNFSYFVYLIGEERRGNERK